MGKIFSNFISFSICSLTEKIAKFYCEKIIANSFEENNNSNDFAKFILSTIFSTFSKHTYEKCLYLLQNSFFTGVIVVRPVIFGFFFVVSFAYSFACFEIKTTLI